MATVNKTAVLDLMVNDKVFLKGVQNTRKKAEKIMGKPFALGAAGGAGGGGRRPGGSPVPGRRPVVAGGGAVGDLRSAAAAVGVTVGAQQAIQFARTAARAKETAIAFNSMAKEIGGAQAVMNAMNRASGGTLSSLQLLEQGTQIMGFGLVKSAEDMEKFITTAVRLGRVAGKDTAEAIRRLSLGIGKLEPELLDEIFLITRLSQEMREYSKATGIAQNKITTATKKQIFFNGVMRDAALIAPDMIVGFDGMQQSLDRLGSSFENAAIGAGAFLEPLVRLADLAVSSPALSQLAGLLNPALAVPGGIAAGIGFASQAGQGVVVNVNIEDPAVAAGIELRAKKFAEDEARRLRNRGGK